MGTLLYLNGHAHNLGSPGTSTLAHPGGADLLCSSPPPLTLCLRPSVLAPPFLAFPFHHSIQRLVPPILPHCSRILKLDDPALGYHLMAWGITLNSPTFTMPMWGVLAPPSATWPRLGHLPFLFRATIAARGCGAAAGVLSAHRGEALR